MIHTQIGVFRLRLIQIGFVLLHLLLEEISAQRTAMSIKLQLDTYDIIPDVLDTYPPNECEVIFSSMQCPPDGRLVNFGNEIRPIETKVEPSVEWPADPMLNYALIMIDPDAPSRVAPTMREWQHWLVVNIPGHDVMSGKVLTSYVGASPPNGTSFHRYVFIVYQQPKRNMTYDEPHIGKKSDQYRSMFSTKRFADEYKLGDPIAINFFQSEYENVKKEED